MTRTWLRELAAAGLIGLATTAGAAPPAPAPVLPTPGIALPLQPVQGQVQLQAPARAEGGDMIMVSWQGPGAPGDVLTIVPLGAGPEARGPVAPVSEGNPLRLTTPDRGGAHEIRYLDGTGSVLARLSLALTEQPIRLSAPASAVAGSQIEVIWQGPVEAEGRVVLVPVGADPGTEGPGAPASDGQFVQLRTPEFAGDYELRFESPDPVRIRASLPISLSAGRAALELPPSAAAGSGFSVRWQGPANPDDVIRIVPEGASELDTGPQAPVSAGNPLILTAPEALGRYEIRYVSGVSGLVLASGVINVTGADVVLSGPEQLEQGALFELDWQGPDGPGDYLTIVPEGAAEGTFTEFATTATGSPARLRAPDQTGPAELRYVSGQGGRTLGRAPVQIIAPGIWLDAPDSALAGARLEIRWDGPDNPGDYLTIVPAGAPEGSYIDYAYTQDGSPARLGAPDQPGAAELRYVSGQGGRTLAAVPLMVGASDVSLRAPEQVQAGQRFEVDWTGPGGPQDYLAIAPAGAPEGAYDAYAYVAGRSPAVITAPDTPGGYELRYVSGASGGTLASLPLRVSR